MILFNRNNYIKNKTMIGGILWSKI